MQKLYHDCFTKISYRNNFSSKCLSTLSLHTIFSVLNYVSSLVRSRVRRYVTSYLTRRGRGFYPGCFRFLSDISVLLADDVISNENYVQFGQIFLRKSPTKVRIVVA